MKWRLLFLLSLSLGAQTVPPAPVITTPVAAVGIGSITIEADAAGCGQSTCGLSSCSCWVQLWRASCTSTGSCPAPVQGSPYVQGPVGSYTSADNGKGGTHFSITNAESALSAGTIWQYFLTVNYSLYTPFTPSAPSNSTGALAIAPPPPATPANFNIQLDYDNSSCITGKTCTSSVYRTACSGTNPSNCPVYNNTPSGFNQITVATTQSVSSTNTHFTSVDSDTTLKYNTLYAYAVTNTLSGGSAPSSSAQITLTTPIQTHSAIINWSNASCRISIPCNLQVYRAVCGSTTTCPVYTPGSAAWTSLNMTTGLISTPGAQGSTWQYTDTGLTGSTVYSWIATNTFVGGSTASAASQSYSGTTSVGRSIKGVK